MTKKRGDDQHGYDPERAAARSLFDRLERQAEQRPDKPARKLGDVLKVPKVTPTTKRLIDAHVKIIDGQPDEKAYLHSVLCQTGLPYRPTDLRRWHRRQGAVTLLIEAAVPSAAGQYIIGTQIYGRLGDRMPAAPDVIARRTDWAEVSYHPLSRPTGDGALRSSGADRACARDVIARKRRAADGRSNDRSDAERALSGHRLD